MDRLHFLKDILRIWKLDTQFLESETHLVSHLFRETESALRGTLRTENEKPNGGVSFPFFWSNLK